MKRIGLEKDGRILSQKEAVDKVELGDESGGGVG